MVVHEYKMDKEEEEEVVVNKVVYKPPVAVPGHPAVRPAPRISTEKSTRKGK